MGFFDELGKSLSGESNRELAEANLKAQNEYNQQLLDLQKQKLAFEQSPEYQKQQRTKIIAISVIVVFVGFVALKVMRVI